MFTNSPTVFTAIFAVVKHWLPEDTKKKLHFYSGDDVPRELLRYVRPAVVQGLDRVVGGEYGDDVARELIADAAYKTSGWKKSYEKTVSARSIAHQYFVLSKTGTKALVWERQDGDESPKSTIHARVLYVRPNQEANVPASEVEVVSVDFKDVSTLTIPAEANEALAILYLDHSSSWFQAHKFRYTVEGK